MATVNTMSDAELAKAERNARRFWVTLVVALLGTQVVIGVGSIFLAVGDPTVAVVPNYHQAALDWDTSHRAEVLLDELEWNVRVRAAAPSADLPQKRALIVRVLSNSNEPVRNLNVRANLFHHARGGDIYRSVFEETQPGVYESTTGLVQGGLWQCELQIEGDHGIAKKSMELSVN